jgi:hypothetical protein
MGTFEPMSVVSLSLYNAIHKFGYTIKDAHRYLSSLGTIEYSARFLGQDHTANGNSVRFGETYNFLKRGAFAIGSASQDYITNTHDKYFPCPQDKLVNIILGTAAQHINTSFNSAYSQDRKGSMVGVTFQPDWMDAPYGIWEDYGPWKGIGKASHLALHPGMIQYQEVLLATLALNGNDKLDGFSLTQEGNLYPGLQSNIILPCFADEIFLIFPNGSTTHFIVPVEAFTLDLPLNTTVALRVGNGSVALRVFYADGVNASTGLLKPGLPAAFQLRGEEKGMALGAMRMVAYHMPQQPKAVSLTQLLIDIDARIFQSIS